MLWRFSAWCPTALVASAARVVHGQYQLHELVNVPGSSSVAGHKKTDSLVSLSPELAWQPVGSTLFLSSSHRSRIASVRGSNWVLLRSCVLGAWLMHRARRILVYSSHLVSAHSDHSLNQAFLGSLAPAHVYTAGRPPTAGGALVASAARVVHGQYQLHELVNVPGSSSVAGHKKTDSLVSLSPELAWQPAGSTLFLSSFQRKSSGPNWVLLCSCVLGAWLIHRARRILVYSSLLVSAHSDHSLNQAFWEVLLQRMCTRQAVHPSPEVNGRRSPSG